MTETANIQTRHVRVAVIGAGLSGVAAGIALKNDGIEDFVIIERAGDVGGVWRDNTYPGVACDIPSHLYSFSHTPNPDWGHTFAPGEQIHDYIKGVAANHDLGDQLEFGEELLEARWDEDRQRWSISTTNLELTAEVLVDGAGPLTEPQAPNIPGLESFEGTIFHSARWNHDHDMIGERVAVLGTGASSIQFVPEIQPRVGHLTVFQRTPGWVLPRFDRRTAAFERTLRRLCPSTNRIQRLAQFLVRDRLHHRMIRRDRPARMLLERQARLHLRRQVRDPHLRAKLTPNFEVGCKRILLSNKWYPALTQPNVDVVAAGVTEIRGRTVIASDTTEREVDTIILGTGFEVLPPPISARIIGRDERTLADVWDAALDHYRAVEVAHFPNYFRLAGVGCALGHGSMLAQIESQVAYLRDALRMMKQRGLASVEVTQQAQNAYMDYARAKLSSTVWAVGGCTSWYQDGHGGLTAMWPGTMGEYELLMAQFETDDHLLTRHPATPLPTNRSPQPARKTDATRSGPQTTNSLTPANTETEPPRRARSRSSTEKQATWVPPP
ncbi:MAG TPA: NAD(P)/FAD-dependent oxidoreductase [Solirubrobacteraceae bacterium]|nr:NAD(P)/FAD-dependent oxidoreductase [Solirubrobacteraceae bacterium]